MSNIEPSCWNCEHSAVCRVPASMHKYTNGDQNQESGFAVCFLTGSLNQELAELFGRHCTKYRIADGSEENSN